MSYNALDSCMCAFEKRYLDVSLYIYIYIYIYIPMSVYK